MTVHSIDVPDGDTPSPEQIAARIDLGCACYHEINCPFMLYIADDSLFSEQPACTCGGEEMAKAYAQSGTEAGGHFTLHEVPADGDSRVQPNAAMAGDEDAR
jgi:hypothetical protein